MKQRLLLLLGVAVVMAPWGPVDWVWDDAVLIVHNDNLGWGRLITMWGEELWAGVPGEHSSAYYRPLMVATLVFDHNVLGGSALLSRLHSLCWHLLCVGLLHRVLKDRPGALIAAALYGVHPVATELVHFVAARNDSMAVASVLGVLLVFEDRAPSLGRRLVGGLIVFAGLLSKESALLVLLVLPLLDRERFGQVRFQRYIELGAGAFAALMLRSAVGLEAPALGDPPMWETVAAYGITLVDPFVYPPPMAPGALTGLAAAGLFALVGVLGLVERKKWLYLLIFGALGLAALGATVSDGLAWRYLALVVMGLCLGLADRLGQRPRIGWLVVGVFGVLSILAKPMWSDNVSFWTTGHAQNPSPATACGAFKALEVSGDDQRAADLLVEALPQPHCCYNASRFWLDRGDPAEALRFGEEALSRGCAQTPELLAPMALSAALSEDWERALRYAADGSDPYGYSKVVLTAEGLRRDDRAALERFGGSPELEARALQLLQPR